MEIIIKFPQLPYVICPIGDREGIPHDITVWFRVGVLQTRVNDRYDPGIRKITD